MFRSILVLMAISVVLATTSHAAAGTQTGLEVRFVDKQGNSVDDRQMGSWIEILNLSTDERLSQRGLSSVLLVPALTPGMYKLSVQRKRTRNKKCGVQHQSWKLRITPGEMNKFTLTVHFINDTRCPVY